VTKAGRVIELFTAQTLETDRNVVENMIERRIDSPVLGDCCCEVRWRVDVMYLLEYATVADG
jgi:hypothetical protein